MDVDTFNSYDYFTLNFIDYALQSLRSSKEQNSGASDIWSSYLSMVDTPFVDLLSLHRSLLLSSQHPSYPNKTQVIVPKSLFNPVITEPILCHGLGVY